MLGNTFMYRVPFELFYNLSKRRTMRHTVTIIIQTPSLHTVAILAYKDAVISYGYNACKYISVPFELFYNLGKSCTMRHTVTMLIKTPSHSL